MSAAGRLWAEAKSLQRLAVVAPGIRWPVCIAGPDRAPGGRPVEFLNVRQPGMLRPDAMRHWFARAAFYARRGWRTNTSRLARQSSPAAFRLLGRMGRAPRTDLHVPPCGGQVARVQAAPWEPSR